MVLLWALTVFDSHERPSSFLIDEHWLQHLGCPAIHELPHQIVVVVEAALGAVLVWLEVDKAAVVTLPDAYQPPPMSVLEARDLLEEEGAVGGRELKNVAHSNLRSRTLMH